MGSPLTEADREDDETLHEVLLTRPFVMMATEVTQGQWRALTGTSPLHFAACGDDCPVESVSWYEAVYFANLASEAEGLAPCYTLRECRNVDTLGAGCDPDDERVWTDCWSELFCWVDIATECDGWRLPTEAEWKYAARAGSIDDPTEVDSPIRRDDPTEVDSPRAGPTVLCTVSGVEFRRSDRG